MLKGFAVLNKMGSLTTVTFWNDDIEGIRKNRKNLCNFLIGCASSGKPGEIHGNFSVKVHRPVNSDDDGVYVCSGNTVCDLSAGSREAEYLARCRGNYFEKMLDYLERNLADLRKMQEKYSKGDQPE